MLWYGQNATAKTCVSIYLSLRQWTQRYARIRNATLYYVHGFPLQKVDIFKLKKKMFGPRNVHAKGHFHLRNAAFVYVTPLLSTYLYIFSCVAKRKNPFRAYSRQRRAFFLLRTFCCGHSAADISKSHTFKWARWRTRFWGQREVRRRKNVVC